VFEVVSEVGYDRLLPFGKEGMGSVDPAPCGRRIVFVLVWKRVN